MKSYNIKNNYYNKLAIEKDIEECKCKACKAHKKDSSKEFEKGLTFVPDKIIEEIPEVKIPTIRRNRKEFVFTGGSLKNRDLEWRMFVERENAGPLDYFYSPSDSE